MAQSDLPAVCAMAAAVHRDFPEEAAIFAERLALAPDGCFILRREEVAWGYLLSHPWRLRQPPPLNSLLHALPDKADTLYIHDLALLPQARGQGAASSIISKLEDLARLRQVSSMSLIAVSGSSPFWSRHGFAAWSAPEMAGKLGSYSAGAVYMERRISPR